MFSSMFSSSFRITKTPRSSLMADVQAAPVMRLALGRLEEDGPAAGFAEGVDLCRQAAPRATHAIGSAVFFIPLAEC
jgi:hypothetical protein